MKFLIVGGAGFIGSYIVDSLLDENSGHTVTVVDNFSSGKRWHLEGHLNDVNLRIVEKDIYDCSLAKEFEGIDVVIMLAANPDIAKAVTEPRIDFDQGTALVQIILEAMRKANVSRIFYASGSGVYGEVGDIILSEDHPRMEPISTYGASKLGCEALICSYCHMFGLKASVFRFGNVVGGRQTHGVAYDFLKKLTENRYHLKILGDGSQSKPYIHISDVVSAINTIGAHQNNIFEVFNVAPLDFISVKEIARIVMLKLDIEPSSCHIEFGLENRGWKGDVPVVRLNTNKLRSYGWVNKFNSFESIERSVEEMIPNISRLYA